MWILFGVQMDVNDQLGVNEEFIVQRDLDMHLRMWWLHAPSLIVAVAFWVRLASAKKAQHLTAAPP